MYDINDTVVTIQELAHPDTNIIFEATVENTLSESIRIAVIIMRLNELNDEVYESVDSV